MEILSSTMDTTDQIPFTDFSAFVDDQRHRNVGLCSSGNESGFVPRSALDEYWTMDKISRVLNAVLPDTDHDAEAIRSHYLQTFSTLVYAGASSVRAMFGELLMRAPNDSMMPVPHDRKPGCSPELNAIVERIAEVQWVFFPLCFTREELSGVTLEAERILPMRVLRVVEREAATISFVKVQDEYNKLASKKDNGEHDQNVFVLKSYRGDGSKHRFDAEIKAYGTLMEKENTCVNIATCYGSFSHAGSRTIVLEAGDAGDLAHFFESQKPPETITDILQFWRSLSGVLSGLSQVHEKGIHQNLSPRHIVLYGKRTANPFDFVPKLIGFEHFAEGHRMERGDDHILAPDTAGEKLYSSPDAHYNASRNTKALKWITDKADIFSLGTLLSHTIAWTKGGLTAQEEYFRKRRDFHRSLNTFKDCGYEGCFHDGFKLLDLVVDFHKEMEENCADASDPITLGLLQIVDYFMLGRWERQRKTARDLASYIEGKLGEFATGDIRMPTPPVIERGKMATKWDGNALGKGAEEKKVWKDKVARLRCKSCFST